jgi:lantibiotic modifying enzyme
MLKTGGLKDILAEIAARAAPLGQILSTGNLNPEADFDAEKGRQRLEQWQAELTGTDQAKFELRLRAAGLTRRSALRLLGSLRAGNPENLPAWAVLLEEFLEGLEGESYGYQPDLNHSLDWGLPFQEILFPFVLLYRRKLTLRWAEPYRGLSVTAQASLEKKLLETLTNLAAQALAVEFAVFKSERQPFWFFNADSFSNPDPAARPSTELYKKFVAAMLEGQLVTFFKEYSALARLLALQTGFFIEATAELLVRLEADRPALQELFGANLGQVVNLELGKSDPHHQGRSVACLEFTNGFKLIYKPRDLRLEAAFLVCVYWCNGQGLETPFKTILY